MDIKSFVDANWSYGENLLHLAVKSNDPNLVKKVLKFGVNVNQLNNNGETALFHCMNIEILKLLLDAGINPNVQDKSTGKTVLFNCKNVEEVRLLLKGGINTNLTEKSKINSFTKLPKPGWNALCVYCFSLDGVDDKGNLEIVHELIPVTNLDYENCKVLRILINNYSTDLSLLEKVISRLKIRHSVNEYGESLLHEAVLNDNYWEVIELLIDVGVDLHIRNTDGKDFYDLSNKDIQDKIENKLPKFLDVKAIKDNMDKFNL